jgi:serine/threonine protein kinase/Flp pilus assembly protein TadD
MIGKTISHYKILEKLGEGGMGVVYKAVDNKLERTVAIKFLPRYISANSEERERFKIEAKAAAALNHPNIAHIYAIEETEDEMFIVMEYIDGNELKEKIESETISTEAAINIATQITEGLEAAHKQGIVHRDIKSSNIMIDNDGKVKIMDFGLAKIRGGTELTKIGSTVGTAAYMSPEQAKGDDVDNRTDLWSLGIIIYQMLSGVLPFKGDYEAAVMYELLNEDPPGLQSFRSDIPDELLKLTFRLMEKDINKRISSASIVLEELKKKPEVKDESSIEKSIAVLYFENMSPDKENEYFCAGITEDIIIDLSKIHELKVIPRTDVLPFRSKEVNSRKVGEVLGVTHILEGSVRKAGQKIRVTAQLIDIQTGFQIWADRYDRLLEDIFDLQVEVSQKIAEALKVSLSKSEKESLTQKSTVDLRAYDFYMRGRDLLTTAGKGNNESAIKMFEHAIAIDPKYSLAYVALAEAYSFQYMYYDGDQKWLGKIIGANQKAQELDPELDEVEMAKGMVLYHQKRFSEAKKIFHKLIAKKNDYYQAFRWLGIIAEVDNDSENALKYFLRAADIKPYSEDPWMHMEMTYRRKGDVKSARASGEKMLELIERKLSINEKDVIALSRAASQKAQFGDEISTLNDIRRVLEIAPNDGLALYNCACSYALLGKKEEAFELLKKTIKIGYKNIIEWVENDPDFEVFRDDPKFKEILASSGQE